MVNSLKYQKELEHLRMEHYNLEDKIMKMMRNKVIDQFKIQDLKKKKLMIKESITQIERILFGDDTAA
ncbi:MAG: hypothetical protein K0R73_151 [Candidatus Midichloriaceae bacterium]|jgi:hypothetical protein|nr:hypothetical protein [Candidatus Midichloriaceae bacterium]